MLGHLLDCVERGEDAALCTIVRVGGSTYRREGARLLVPRSGSPVGNLSGGCLEGEVETAAREVMDSGQPRVETYDLTADDEVVWGWGLGCNGVIEVLIEPASAAAETAALIAHLEEQSGSAVIAVALDDSAGAPAGTRWQAGVGEVPGEIAEALSHAAAEGRSGVREVAGGRVFVEVIEPPARILVCGAGHDAIPFVRAGIAAGFSVTVADDRAPMLSAERFPGAELVETEPAKVAVAAAPDERTYAVIMSHNFLRDRDYLGALLDSECAYIGSLGPRARLERLLGELEREPDDRLHGPAGLDIGAEGPDEIAVALVAEIIAVRSGRDGGRLRDRKGSIHGSAG